MLVEPFAELLVNELLDIALDVAVSLPLVCLQIEVVAGAR